MRIRLPTMDRERVADEIGSFLIDTMQRQHATGYVIGLSGGVDSTTTAALAKRALDKHNAAHNTSFELVGYILPSRTNDPSDTADGIRVAQRLGIRYEVHNLEPLLNAYATTNPEATSKYDKGNMTSRIRAVVLNTKAATENKVLAGTGNRDEDYGIGYYTLFGDGAVHCSPIGGLSKRLVRQMAAYLGFADLAGREPTAGLEPQQTDFRDLCYKYDVVEIVTEGLDQGLTPEVLAHHEQVKPLVEQQLQEYTARYGTPKLQTVDDVISDIMRRKKIAEAKARIIHPPTPDITLEYR